jgi:hypothetical protein
MTVSNDARGPLTFALVIGAAGVIVWMLFHHVTVTTPKVGSPIPPSDDPEVRLCDQAVDTLLHSKDLVEVTRAGIIIQHVNCGIGKRL